MKRNIAVFAVLLFISSVVFAQKIEKPTKTARPITDEQRATIVDGIDLHREQKYSEAIAKYEIVLSQNPDSTLAIYEKAHSLYMKGDKELALSTALEGAKYLSDELPLFYLLIANALDDKGKPNEAIKIYQDALKILKKEKNVDRAISSVHFNLGITFARQNKTKEAKDEMKKAIEYNPGYSSPHFILSELWGNTHKVPSLLAAIRFISLEYNTARADRAVATVKRVLEPAKKDEKTGSINIFLNLDAPKDEGDFGMYDLLLGTLMTVKGENDEKKSPEELFAEGVDTAIALLSEDKKLGSTFVGKQYVPFIKEMKERGYSHVFAYIVSYKSNNKNQAALNWLAQNQQKMNEFLQWSKTFRNEAN